MSNRPSYIQLEALAEFLEQNPGIAKGVLRSTHGKMETKRKWATLATSLNALEGVCKDGRGWSKYWAERKCALKKQYAQILATIRRTGGDTSNMPALSVLDSRLVAVMDIDGQEFGYRDTNFSVDSSPESSRQIVEPPVTDPLVVEILNRDMSLAPSASCITSISKRKCFISESEQATKHSEDHTNCASPSQNNGICESYSQPSEDSFDEPETNCATRRIIKCEFDQSLTKNYTTSNETQANYASLKSLPQNNTINNFCNIVAEEMNNLTDTQRRTAMIQILEVFRNIHK